MSSATPHRIDPATTGLPHLGGPHVPARRRRLTVSAADQVQSVASDGLMADAAPGDREVLESIEPGVSESCRSEAWLELHANDLIDRLQAWASDLDAREAKLNARASMQDLRERSFRLSRQDVATELAEQRRAIERLRAEIEAQARRLAFQT